MPLFFRTDAAPASIEDRVNGAAALALAALSTFHDVVADLEAAADESESASAEAHATADYHRTVAEQAQINATQARQQAAKVREFIG